MASRGHSWFDAEKLLSGERLVRSSPAQLRIAIPPYWWEGELILTSDRVFFLPFIEHPMIDAPAFWLADIVRGERDAGETFKLITRESAVAFRLAGKRRRLGYGASDTHRWLRDIELCRPKARPASTFRRTIATGDERPPRRAAG